MPGEARVSPGTTVTWTNQDGPAHTVTFDDGSLDAVLQTGDTAQATLTEPGTYRYVCRFHANMQATIVVG